MKRLVICFALFAFFVNPSVFAAIAPKASKEDRRVQKAIFNANEVYAIWAKAGYVSMLQFDKDEQIAEAFVGFLDGWKIENKKNLLIIKPISYQIKEDEQNLPDGAVLVVQPNPRDWKTNLIVTTDKRIYTFDLNLVLQSPPSYRVDFLYPDQEREREERRLAILRAKLAASKAKAAAENAKRKEAETIEKELSDISTPMNYDFVQHINKNSSDIAPNYAYDDGTFTYLAFDTSKAIPSVFEFDKENKESILNTHITKDNDFTVVVIHKVPAQLLLRSGKKLVGIKNRGVGKNVYGDKETKSKRVKRVINGK